MVSNKAFIFPGQGAQAPKMGFTFFEKYAVAREVYEEAEELLKMDLRKLIFEGDVSELTLTKNCQPAIFVTSMAILKVIEKEFPELTPDICGGLSLGEYSALCASKKASFEDVVKLVSARGKFMHQSAVDHPGTMAVVMGLKEETIADAGFHIANVNSPGQIVIAGTNQDIARSIIVLMEKGAKRVKQINVAGAFHSPLMDEAKEMMKPLIEKIEICASEIELVMNVVGSVVKDCGEIKDHLTSQVNSMTRWLDCVLTMETKEPTCYFELGPAQLGGMNRKIGVSAPTISIQEVKDLEKIYETAGK